MHLVEDDVNNALRAIDESNNKSAIKRMATADSEAKFYIANKDYTARPGLGEISLKEGDKVIVLSDEEQGYVMAEVAGTKGMIPLSCVVEYSAKHPVSSSLTCWHFLSPFCCNIEQFLGVCNSVGSIPAFCNF